MRLWSSVEKTLNELLDAEAYQICGAQRYEYSPERVDRRAGFYKPKLGTKVDDMRVKRRSCARCPSRTAVIERYRRREASVEEAPVEMYLAGVSVPRVEDITEAVSRRRVSSGTGLRLNQNIYRHIKAWRSL